MKEGTVLGRRHIGRVGLLGILSVLLLGAITPALATPIVVTTVAVDASPEGVVVSPATNCAYVTNAADGTVSVINTTTNTVIALIPVGTQPIGAAVNPVTNRLYVANDTATGTVSVVDTTKNTVISTVAVGSFPKKWRLTLAYVTNSASNTVSVIDMTTNLVTAAFPGGMAPFGVAVNPVTGSTYVADGDPMHSQ